MNGPARGKENDNQKVLVAIIGAVALVLAAATAPSVTAFVSNLIVSPRFQTSPSPDFASVNITNVGGAAAHQVRITLVLPGDQTRFSKFSSENATWLESYDSTGNQTVIVATLPRLSEQGVVSVKFDHYTRTLEVWINSNEGGNHQFKTKGVSGVGQFIDSGLFQIGALLFVVYAVFLLFTFRKRLDIKKMLRL